MDGRQYIAVQTGWGARAERVHDYVDRARGTRTHVLRGGMIRVFALKPYAVSADATGHRVWRRLPDASQVGLQLRDARIALGDSFLEPGPRLPEPGLGVFEPRLRRPAGRILLLHPFAHLLVGREVFPGLRVAKPQSAVFVELHIEPERMKRRG